MTTSERIKDLEKKLSEYENNPITNPLFASMIPYRDRQIILLKQTIKSLKRIQEEEEQK